MGVSDEAKNVIPLKFLRKIINNFFFSSCKLNPGTYCILIRRLVKCEANVQEIKCSLQAK
jgi:hypothetical protein